MATVQIKDLTTKTLDSTLALIAQEVAGGAGSCGKVLAGKVLGGGFYEVTSADNVILPNSCPANIQIEITVTGKSVSLPAMNVASSMSSNGVGRILLYNKGTESFELLDNGTNVLMAVVSPGDFLVILIDDSSTANGTFTIHKILTQLNDDLLGAGYHVVNGEGTYNVPVPMKTVINVIDAGLGTNIILPNMTDIGALQANKCPNFIVYNNHIGSSSVVVKDITLATLVIISPGEGYLFTVTSNATAAGTFIFERIVMPSATSTQSGYLSSADWITFNSKQDSLYNGGYLSISSAVDYDLTNPSPTIIDASFSAINKILRLADLSQSNSLKASDGAIIRVRNVGSNIFQVRNFAGTFFYDVIPNQIVEFEIIDNGGPGTLSAVYSMVAPVNTRVAYGKSTGGSGEVALTNKSTLTYDDSVDILTAGNFSGINTETLVINQATNYQMVSPAPARINATFTVPDCALITPDYNPSLPHLTRTPITIFNAGSETFILMKFGPSILYSMVFPGQTITIYPTGGGADYSILNEHIAPTDFGGIPYAVTGGSYTYRTSSLFTFNDIYSMVQATKFSTINSDFLDINQGTNYALSNPCPALIRANFTAGSLSLTLPAMNDNYMSPRTPIRIYNYGSNTFILKNNSGFIMYSQVLPGQTIDVYPIDWSSAGGSFYISNLGLDPVFMQVPYAVSGGSATLSYSPNMTFDGNTFKISSITGGIVPPSGTTTQKNAVPSPSQFQLYGDTTLGKLCVYIGAAWETIPSA